MTIADFLNLIYGLQAAAGSLKNYLSVTELLRVVLPALLHGGLTAVLSAIVANASTIFVDPTVAGVVVALITAIVQVARLLGHGDIAPLGYRR